MTDIPVGTVLLCPSPIQPQCDYEFELQPDPEAAQAALLRHLTGAPHYHQYPVATDLLAEAEERRR